MEIKPRIESNRIESTPPDAPPAPTSLIQQQVLRLQVAVGDADAVQIDLGGGREGSASRGAGRGEPAVVVIVAFVRRRLRAHHAGDQLLEETLRLRLRHPDIRFCAGEGGKRRALKPSFRCSTPSPSRRQRRRRAEAGGGGRTDAVEELAAAAVLQEEELRGPLAPVAVELDDVLVVEHLVDADLLLDVLRAVGRALHVHDLHGHGFLGAAVDGQLHPKAGKGGGHVTGK